MSKQIRLSINKIKSINHTDLVLPLDNGVYAIIGNNGIGKSTIIYSMAQLINGRSLETFGVDYRDGDSYVEFETDGVINRWNVQNISGSVRLSVPSNQIRFNGMYEGSLFFGFRFKNFEKVKNLIEGNRITDDILVKADSYIVENLGYILHGEKEYYNNTKIVRIKNKTIVKSMGLQETPYFLKTNSSLISQYGMSSGESLMLSLLHFIYNSIVRRSLDPNYPVLMLIDEIEIALHPIAVSRFLDLLNDLIEMRDNLIIYITSHSPEVINKIKPQNMFKIEHDQSENNSSLMVVNPCYPSYAIRDVYRHDGYDWLLLVEDNLAKLILENVIEVLGLNKSKLIHITPVGGWENVLKLQIDLITNNVLGSDKKIISILDGDIKAECNSKKYYRDLPKQFLPVASVEKFLKKVLVDHKDNQVFKRINDEFFQLKSLNSVVQDYKNSNPNNDNSGKKFYKEYILATIKIRNIDEDQFIIRLSKIIRETVDFTQFDNSISSLIN